MATSLQLQSSMPVAQSASHFVSCACLSRILTPPSLVHALVLIQGRSPRSRSLHQSHQRE